MIISFYIFTTSNFYHACADLTICVLFSIIKDKKHLKFMRGSLFYHPDHIVSKCLI